MLENKPSGRGQGPRFSSVILAVILVVLGLLLVIDIWLAVRELHRDGQTLILLSTALGVSAIGILFWRLVESRRQAIDIGRTLNETNTRYETILNDQTESVIRYTPDMRITFVNRAFCEVYGDRPDKWVGHNVLDVLPPVAREVTLNAIGQLSPEKRVVSDSVSIIDQEGQMRRRRFVIQGIFDAGGRLREVQGTGSDITEQWQKEQELEHYRTELEQLVDERTAALQQQTRIANSLQHVAYVLNASLDLETVLNAIMREIRYVRSDDALARVWFASGRQLVVAAQIGIGTDPIKDITLSLDEPHWPSVAAYLRGETVINNDLWDADWPGRVTVPTWRSLIAIPLQRGDQTLGVLQIASEQPGAYGPDEVTLLQSFAAHASLALANAQEFGSSTLLAMTAERERLSRDLHDSVTQTLFSASLHAEALPVQILRDPELAMTMAEKLSVLNRGALGEMRSLLVEMRPQLLTASDLRTLLGYLCSATQTRVRVRATLDISGVPYALPSEVHVAFYRVAQEALNNIVKHAEATEARVLLDYGVDTLTLRVEDDGRGFTPTAAANGTFGLHSMRERAELIGATLTVDSEPEQGTAITLCWPHEDGAAASLS